MSPRPFKGELQGRRLLWGIMVLTVCVRGANGQAPATEPEAVTQQAVDSAMARLQNRVRDRESQARPASRPSDNASSASLTEEQKRASKLQTVFKGDLERARNERKTIASRMPPKSSSDARREWAEDKRATLAELDSKISTLQARLIAFEQLSDVDLKRLLDEYEDRQLVRRKTVREIMTAHYDTISKSAQMILDQLGSAVQSARYINGNSEMATYQVTYVSRDQLVRAAKLRITFNAVSDPSDPAEKVIYYYPTGAFLEVPFESPQNLPFKDPVPPEVTVEWDAKAGFRIVGG